MEIRNLAGKLLQGVVVIVVVSLLAGQVLGQPILLSFVTTGSMEPTLEPGDGFVAIPAELSGDIEEGDVIVFEAEEIQGGGLTTHRVVDETEEGYITQGDANPFTDQDSDEPPVKEPDIKAVAWQPAGGVFAIPGVGTAVNGIQSGLESLQWTLAQLFGTRALLGTQGIAYLLFAGSIVLYILAGVFESEQKDRERSADRETGTSARNLMIALTLVVVAGATAAMIVPAGTQEFGIVSAEFQSDSPDVIEQGTSESFEYTIGNPGVIPVEVMLEPSGERLEATPEHLSIDRRSTANATVTISAPPETGYYRAFLGQYRYLAILPTPVIETLYELHPWAPILVIDAVIGIPFYLFGMVVLGSGRMRSRRRERGSWLS
jgi:signal peptidase